MTYGFDADHLMVWIDAYERVNTDRSGVLCRRHADAMVVPLGWMLDDRRDPVPRLFKAPAQPTTSAPRHRRVARHHGDDTEQLELAAGVVVTDIDEVIDAVAEAPPGVDDRGNRIDAEVMPWKPMFDQTDDLDGLLEARGPLLARAFGGRDRPRSGK
jgi:hypothetical protein